MTRPDRAPLSLTIGAATTPLGDLLLVADIDGKLRAAEFSDREARLHLLLDRRLGKGGYRLAAGAVPPGVATALDAYFAGDVASIDRIEVAMAGTAFQERVWRGLRAIRPGTTRSYGALAGELGLPRSARAVGHANGANPFENRRAVPPSRRHKRGSHRLCRRSRPQALAPRPRGPPRPALTAARPRRYPGPGICVGAPAAEREDERE